MILSTAPPLPVGSTLTSPSLITIIALGTRRAPPPPPPPVPPSLFLLRPSPPPPPKPKVRSITGTSNTPPICRGSPKTCLVLRLFSRVAMIGWKISFNITLYLLMGPSGPAVLPAYLRRSGAAARDSG